VDGLSCNVLCLCRTPNRLCMPCKTLGRLGALCTPDEHAKSFPKKMIYRVSELVGQLYRDQRLRRNEVAKRDVSEFVNSSLLTKARKNEPFRTRCAISVIVGASRTHLYSVTSGLRSCDMMQVWS
jgi:hypothetical protein